MDLDISAVITPENWHKVEKERVSVTEITVEPKTGQNEKHVSNVVIFPAVCNFPFFFLFFFVEFGLES
jgi:hypothetical protein